MLTDVQKVVLKKFRKEGTKDFTRNEYQILATIRKHCIEILMNYEEALNLYVELTK